LTEIFVKKGLDGSLPTASVHEPPLRLSTNDLTCAWVIGLSFQFPPTNNFLDMVDFLNSGHRIIQFRTEKSPQDMFQFSILSSISNANDRIRDCAFHMIEIDKR